MSSVLSKLVRVTLKKHRSMSRLRNHAAQDDEDQQRYGGKLTVNDISQKEVQEIRSLNSRGVIGTQIANQK